jgi:glutamate-5-semialdehyde dehydrogenase
MDAVEELARRAKDASYRLQAMPAQKRNAALEAMAVAIAAKRRQLLEANLEDVRRSEAEGLSKVLVKRLRFDEEKVEESLRMLHSLMAQEDPLNKVIARTELDEGLILEKVTCPIGVMGVIFEARPEALVQISALCLKSGNAVLLKGGSEAKLTNEALARCISDAIVQVDAAFEGAVQLLSTREEVHALLAQDRYVDLIIPRGSNELVRSIQASTRIPVLGHAAGICHTFVDKTADLDMALEVCFDAKVQYPAVCNAMETLLVHAAVAKEFLPRMAKRYADAKVQLRGDARAREMVPMEEACAADWDTEYNDLILSITVVDSLPEAVRFINLHGSHHTDAIITKDEAAATFFMDNVDSSSVLWNCSTRFADGYRYGLGAEVGISTNKTHARGPVGLEGLMIYKWRLIGHGHVVADYAGKDAKQYTHRKML